MLKSITRARFGTRGSQLARWQTSYVQQLLQTAHTDLDLDISVFHTYGDRVLETPLPSIGGKGVFTAELEAALQNRSIDIAVHSLKDLPTESPSGLIVGAIPARANAADVLVSRQGYTLETLPPHAVVGTSSQRRKAQLLHVRPDLHIVDTRGNIDTRIRKALAEDSVYDAILLAQAGLQRLEFGDLNASVLPLEQMLPAPGQGALGIQCRAETAWLDLLAPLNHDVTWLAVTAERAFLMGLGGGCAMPIAAYASIEHDVLCLAGRVCSLDGTREVDISASVLLTGVFDLDRKSAFHVGIDLAQVALQQGAAEILETVR
jgi:hydroxymethylbilane synthase